MAYTNGFLILVVIYFAKCQTTDPGQNNVSVTLIDGFDTNTVREGDAMYLQCEVDANAAPAGGRFQWRHTSTKTGVTRDISSSLNGDGLSRVTIEDDVNSGNPTSDLTMSKVTQNDEGAYTCNYSVNDNELIGSLVVDIAFLPDPECLQSHVGDAVQFTLCVSEHASPNITLQWKHKTTGETIEGTVTTSNGQIDNILSIGKIPGGDVNSLVCVVTNPAFPDSEKTCTFHIGSPTSTETVVVTNTQTTEKSTETSIDRTTKPTEGNTQTSTGTTTTNHQFTTIRQTEKTVSEEITTGLRTTMIFRSEMLTDTITTKNTTIDVPKLGSSGNDFFGITEIIIIASAGGVIVLIFVILAILNACRLRRAPRSEKVPEVILSFDTIDTTDTSISNDAYVEDTTESQAYFVLERMEELKADASSPNDVNEHPMYAAVSKSKANTQSEENAPRMIPLNIYDSVAI